MEPYGLRRACRSAKAWNACAPSNVGGPCSSRDGVKHAPANLSLNDQQGGRSSIHGTHVAVRARADANLPGRCPGLGLEYPCPLSAALSSSSRPPQPSSRGAGGATSSTRQRAAGASSASPGVYCLRYLEVLSPTPLQQHVFGQIGARHTSRDLICGLLVDSGV